MGLTAKGPMTFPSGTPGDSFRWRILYGRSAPYMQVQRERGPRTFVHARALESESPLGCAVFGRLNLFSFAPGSFLGATLGLLPDLCGLGALALSCKAFFTFLQIAPATGQP